MRGKAVDIPVVWLTVTALLVLSATIVLSYKDWLIFRDASSQARDARAVLESTGSLVSALSDAETGQRGFLLTDDPQYLDTYRAGIKAAPEHLKRLEELAASDGDHNGAILKLKPLVPEKLDELQRTLDAKAAQGTAAALAIVNTDRGKALMDQIRDLCSHITSVEYATLVERRQEFEISGTRTRLMTTIGSAVLFVLLILAGSTIHRAATRREQLMEEVRSTGNRVAEVRDLLETTLSSIGDAVIATDTAGKITFINPVAQTLTGYTHAQAFGRPLAEIFRIVNESTRQTVEIPAERVMREGIVVGLANHTILIAQDGRETPIDDSGAPIRSPGGALAGVVLVFRDITERRKAEEETIRVASIVAHSAEAIASQRLDGTVTSWNAAAVRTFGYTEAEMMGNNLAVLAAGEGVEDPEAVLRRILAGETAIHYDAVRRRKDGALIEISAVASPIRDNSGTITGISRIGRDVTEKKRAEAAILRSEKQKADILESIRDGFVALDGDWKFTYVNAEAERRLGKPRGDLLGKNYWEEFPLALGSETERHMRRCVSEQNPYSFEERLRTDVDGWFEVNLYPATEGGIAMYFRDVTERKRTEAALRETEEQLRLATEAAQIGAWQREVATGNVTWSHQQEKMYGIEPGEFRNHLEHVHELIHPEDRRRVAEAAARAAYEDADFEIEFRLAKRAPDGQDRWLLSRGRVVQYSDHGQPLALAGVTLDITGRRRLEEKMRQAQKLESLGILAGGIAHDFNNLLMGILGNASMLMEDAPRDSPQRALLESLTRASERAAHLTRQMLAYSGRGRFVVERLDLSAQVREILALVDASIPKGVRIKLDFAENLPQVEADAGQIQQLIMNLVINGAEAIGSCGGAVTISTALDELGAESIRDNLAGEPIPPGTYLRLEVRDTGSGMDAETKAKIFDPFFTTKFTGRGLGLAAALGIVRSHGGALTLDSEPDRGTTFRVFLPAMRARRDAAAQDPAGALEFRGEGTVLVVDDEEIVQRTMKAALERYGYVALAAGSGPEAIEILAGTPGVSLVMLDMTMPGMSGEQVLEVLNERYPALPVIATSGYSEAEALGRFGAGLSGFIQKPYTPRQLAEKIWNTLHAKGATA